MGRPGGKKKAPMRCAWGLFYGPNTGIHPGALPGKHQAATLMFLGISMASWHALVMAHSPI